MRLSLFDLSPHEFDQFELLTEESANVASFSYSKSRDDPQPRVLTFGRWTHPSSNNNLVCGLNLNYLDENDHKRVIEVLPRIMSKDTVKSKYWEAMAVIPTIVRRAYRTYDEKAFSGLQFDTLEYGEPIVPEPSDRTLEPLSANAPDNETAEHSEIAQDIAEVEAKHDPQKAIDGHDGGPTAPKPSERVSSAASLAPKPAEPAPEASKAPNTANTTPKPTEQATQDKTVFNKVSKILGDLYNRVKDKAGNKLKRLFGKKSELVQNSGEITKEIGKSPELTRDASNELNELRRIEGTFKESIELLVGPTDELDELIYHLKRRKLRSVLIVIDQDNYNIIPNHTARHLIESFGEQSKPCVVLDHSGAVLFDPGSGIHHIDDDMSKAWIETIEKAANRKKRKRY